MSNIKTTVTDQQIETLMREAAEAGDMAQFDLCRRALSGDEAARAACVAAISDAEAQRTR